MKKVKLVFLLAMTLIINLTFKFNVLAAEIKEVLDIKDNYVSMKQYVELMGGTYDKVEVEDDYGYENYPTYKYVITLNGGMTQEGGKTIEIFENGRWAYINGKMTPLTTNEIDGFKIPGDDKINDSEGELKIPVEFFESALGATIKDDGKVEITLPEKPKEDNNEVSKPDGKPNSGSDSNTISNSGNNSNTNNGNTGNGGNTSKPDNKPNTGNGSTQKPTPPKPETPTPPPTPEAPKPTPETPKPEKVYTGASVYSSLQGIGFTGNIYGDDEYGYGKIMQFQNIGSSDIDMRFAVYDMPPELAEKIQQACNIVLPGYGGTLYSAISSGANQTLTIGGRKVTINNSSSIIVNISPING